MKAGKERQRVYNLVFDNEMGKQVLAELRRFCCATRTTFSNCPYETARNEGRREVFLQIINAMKIDFEDNVYNYEENIEDIIND